MIENGTERCEISVDRRNHKSLSLGASAALLGFLLMLGVSGASSAPGTVVKEPQDGFSFTLPTGWQEVPLNGSDVTALLNIATHNDPSLTKALGSEVSSAPAKGMKVFAIGPATGSVGPDVDVIVASSAGTPTGRNFALAAIVEAKIEFTQIGARHIGLSIATSPWQNSPDDVRAESGRQNTNSVTGPTHSTIPTWRSSR